MKLQTGMEYLDLINLGKLHKGKIHQVSTTKIEIVWLWLLFNLYQMLSEVIKKYEGNKK